MSRGRKTKEEQLEILKNEKAKKIEEAQKIKEEIQAIENKITELQDQILLKEAEESKMILSDNNISLVEITKALKEGNFDLLKNIHMNMNTPGSSQEKGFSEGGDKNETRV